MGGQLDSLSTQINRQYATHNITNEGPFLVFSHLAIRLLSRDASITVFPCPSLNSSIENTISTDVQHSF